MFAFAFGEGPSIKSRFEMFTLILLHQWPAVCSRLRHFASSISLLLESSNSHSKEMKSLVPLFVRF